MNCYIITYDMDSDMPNYNQVRVDMINAIHDPDISHICSDPVLIGQGIKILVASTSYVIKSSKNAEYIKNFLLNKIGSRYIKKLFIAHVTNDADWHGLSSNKPTWLNLHL